MDKQPPLSSEDTEHSLNPKTQKFIDDVISICHKHKLVLVSKHVNDTMVITKITAPALSNIKNAKTDFKKVIKSNKKEEKQKSEQKSKANFKFYKKDERENK